MQGSIIMVHLFSVSVCEFTEIFQVPKETNTRLALLTQLNENETCSNMQIRAMPLVGVGHSLLCSVCVRVAANILLHLKKHDIFYLGLCILSRWEVHIWLQSHKMLWFMFFIPNMFSCMRDLYWLLTAFTWILFQKPAKIVANLRHPTQYSLILLYFWTFYQRQVSSTYDGAPSSIFVFSVFTCIFFCF